MSFKKICKKCDSPFEGAARNERFCPRCKKREPKERVGRFTISESFWNESEVLSYLVGFCYSDGSTALGKSGKVANVRFLNSDKLHVENITRRMVYDREVSLNRPPSEGKPNPIWENIIYGRDARRLAAFGS